MKTVAVIPCLNEEKHISNVVEATKQYVDVVLVTDGGSTDRTVELAKQAGAKVYVGNTDKKRGYGANLNAGIRRAMGKERADVVVILDGDGQHNPSEIPALLEPIIQGRADVVMGNRFAKDGMPGYRLLGNRVLSTVCNLGARQTSPDAVTGFWAIRRQSVPVLTERKWAICIEMFVKMRAKGWRVAAVPITPIYHSQYGDNSTLSPLKLALLILWAIVKWRMKCEVFRR